MWDEGFEECSTREAPSFASEPMLVWQVGPGSHLDMEPLAPAMEKGSKTYCQGPRIGESMHMEGKQATAKAMPSSDGAPNAAAAVLQGQDGRRRKLKRSEKKYIHDLAPV